MWRSWSCHYTLCPYPCWLQEVSIVTPLTWKMVLSSNILNTLILYMWVNRAITNYASIGEYHLRFFPRELFECPYRVYLIKSRYHILHIRRPQTLNSKTIVLEFANSDVHLQYYRVHYTCPGSSSTNLWSLQILS